MVSKGLRAKPIVIRLAETAEKAPLAPKEIQLFKTGQFKHPSFGNFAITSEVLNTMVTNFKDNVREIDLSLDYQHENEDIAAGWIKDLRAATDGLWAEIDWTPRGKQAVESREFRYVSPEFNMNYKSNENEESFGPTLFGAGLTNRPFLKGMDPIVELAEGKGHSNMTPEEIKKLQEDFAAEKKSREAAELKLSESQKTIDDAKAEKMKADKSAKFDTMLKDGKVCEAQREAYLTGDMTKFTDLAMTVKFKEGGTRDKGDEVVTAKDGKEAQVEIIKLAEKKSKEDKITMDKAISFVLKEQKQLREKYEAATSVREHGGL